MHEDDIEVTLFEDMLVVAGQREESDVDRPLALGRLPLPRQRRALRPVPSRDLPAAHDRPRARHGPATTAAFSTSPCRERAIRPATRRRGRTMVANVGHPDRGAPLVRARSRPCVFPALDNIPQELPILPLRGMTVFPLAVVPLQVGQPRSLRLIDDVMREGRLLGPRRPAAPRTGEPRPRTTATPWARWAAWSSSCASPRAACWSRSRASSASASRSGRRPSRTCGRESRLAPDTIEQTTEVEALRRLVADEFRRLAASVQSTRRDRGGRLRAGRSPRPGVHRRRQRADGAGGAPGAARAGQRGWQARASHPRARSRAGDPGARAENPVVGPGADDARAQREYFLREQLRAIRRSSAKDEGGDETAELRKPSGGRRTCRRRPAARPSAS